MNSPDAPKDIVLENLEWIRRLAEGLLRDRGGAEEIVQETWIRARKTPPRQGQGERAWLSRVVQNLVVDTRRSEARRREIEALGTDTTLARPDGKLETHALQAELRARVNELEEPYRSCIQKRWLEELSVAEMAVEEAVPESTVRTRLRRGAAMIRERVERESGGEGRQWLAIAAQAPAAKLVGARTAGSGVLGVIAWSWGGSVLTKFVKGAIALLLGVTVATVVLSPPPTSTQSVSEGHGRLAKVTDGALVRIGGSGAKDEGPSRIVEGNSATRAGVEALGEEPAQRRLRLMFPKAAANTGSDKLVVHVLDSSARPLPGAPVGIFRGRDGSSKPVISLTTNRAGKATIRGVSQHFERLGNRAFFVGLDLNGVEDERVHLSLSSLSAEPVVLHAPDVGTVTVRTVTAAGKPFPCTGRFIVITHRPGGQRGRSSIHLRNQSEATFPYVAAGLPLTANVQAEVGLKDGIASSEGVPSGGDLVISVVMGVQDPIVTGRLVNNDGEPLGQYEGKVSYDDGGMDRILSLGKGEFKLVLSRGEPGATGVIGMVSVQPPGVDSAPALTGQFTFDVPGVGETATVGDIQVALEPLLVAGAVVHPDGTPAARAEFFLLTWIPDAVGGNGRWGTALGSGFTTDGGGKFAIHGETDGVDLGIVARERERRRACLHPVPFTPGDLDVKVQLIDGHSIRGRVQLPEGCESSGFDLTIRSAPVGRDRLAFIGGSSVVLEPDGSFEFQDVPAGEIELCFEPGSGDQFQFGPENARVTERLTVGDPSATYPQLNPWNLGLSWRYVDLAAIDSTGHAVEEVRFKIGRMRLEPSAGRAHAFIPVDGPSEGVATAPGFAPTPFRPGVGKTEVVMREGITVQIELESPVPVLPEGWKLSLIVAPVAPGDGPNKQPSIGRPRTSRQEVHAGQSGWAVRLSQAGSYQARWEVSRPRREGERQRQSKKHFGYRRDAVDLQAIAGARPTVHQITWDQEGFTGAVLSLNL